MLTTKIGTDNDLVRTKWVISELQVLKPGLKLLDAGAGELKFKPYCTHLEYIAQDFGSYDGEGDDKGLQTNTWDNSKLDIVSDITSIPLQEIRLMLFYVQKFLNIFLMQLQLLKSLPDY